MRPSSITERRLMTAALVHDRRSGWTRHPDPRAPSEFSCWIGIFAGAVLAISAIWWMPYYPIWSLTYIAIGLLVIYALAVYGGHQSIERVAA
jgi:hypothetical protein